MVLLRVIASSNRFLSKKYPIRIQSRQLARIRSSTGRKRPPQDPTTSTHQCEQNLNEPSFISSKLDEPLATTTNNKDSTRKYNSVIAIVKEVWRQYKWTWQGFFQSNLSSDHFIYTTKEQEEEALKEQEDKAEQEDKPHESENKEAKKTPLSPENEEATTIFNPDKIRNNFNRNINDIRTQGPKLAEKMTGMNQEEFSKFIGDQMRLATDCIAHLMQGYRQGRDQEIDNMLHKYFQEEEQPQKQSATNGLDDVSPALEQSNPSSISGRRRRRKNHHLTSKLT